ncbi:class I SAM-dependent methyltransferase [Meridianimarinicoccus aquatilis]|uniref:Methyltransferase domain-containing protein n=1 Tax=Meridianimarinicoccus aquatilis TaxID=2552766 RepID=A0A4V3BCS1_9RHOB|nr:methyltransferase domain-containing protein [Fluviibacterium aquatile]TDL91399.1 methyltransferase domain-containing protein [Fluviibacterium aquatile]
MHLDVQDLKTFYYRTRLGRAAQRVIRDRVVTRWPNTKGHTVVGFGFAVPLLRPFLVSARRVIGLMPAPQGVMAWPVGMENVSVLCEDAVWPLPTGLVDRLVIMHGLETSENPSALLDEASRVLGPGGRVLLIVPNRAGLWARSDQTPFGYGRPYSLGQLEAQLKRHGFRAEGHEVALFQPPSHRKFWLKSGPFCESVGHRLSNTYAGGVLIVEAVKESAQASGTPVRDGMPDPLRVLDGMRRPASVSFAAPEEGPCVAGNHRPAALD